MRAKTNNGAEIRIGMHIVEGNAEKGAILCEKDLPSFSIETTSDNIPRAECGSIYGAPAIRSERKLGTVVAMVAVSGVPSRQLTDVHVVGFGDHANSDDSCLPSVENADFEIEKVHRRWDGAVGEYEPCHHLIHTPQTSNVAPNSEISETKPSSSFIEFGCCLISSGCNGDHLIAWPRIHLHAKAQTFDNKIEFLSLETLLIELSFQLGETVFMVL